MIDPLVKPGFSGSKEMFPEIPPAEPLIDSSNASNWKIIVFTPFGSLKSKVLLEPNASTGRKDEIKSNIFIIGLPFKGLGFSNFFFENTKIKKCIKKRKFPERGFQFRK